MCTGYSWVDYSGNRSIRNKATPTATSPEYPCTSFFKVDDIVKSTAVSLHSQHIYIRLVAFLSQNTGLFISPSGISDRCGTVAGMVTPRGSMSTEGDTLQVSVLRYRCSICAPLVTRQMSIL
jgi:hypothetical protein